MRARRLAAVVNRVSTSGTGGVSVEAAYLVESIAELDSDYFAQEGERMMSAAAVNVMGTPDAAIKCKGHRTVRLAGVVTDIMRGRSTKPAGSEGEVD